MARIDKQRRVIGSGAQRESIFSPPPYSPSTRWGLKSNRKSEDQDRWQGRVDECALRPFHNIHRGLHALFASFQGRFSPKIKTPSELFGPNFCGPVLRGRYGTDYDLEEPKGCHEEVRALAGSWSRPKLPNLHKQAG